MEACQAAEEERCMMAAGKDLINGQTASQGCPPDVIERQLAHIEQNKVRAAYHRTEYLPQRREMMRWYSEFLKQRFDAAKAMF